MKKFLSLKYLNSVCFLALLVAMLGYTLRPSYYIAYHQLENIRSGTGFSRSQAEDEFMDSMPGKDFAVTFNGGFQRLMGLRQVNERYLMNNGHLTYTIPEMDVTEMAENTVAFRDALAEEGIPMGYVCTLFKIDPEDPQLHPGIEDHSADNIGRFLTILRENDVLTLDLRQRENEEGLDHYSLFFRTDHHWLPETGFWAYTQIVSWLEGLDSSFAVDPVLTDFENYSRTVYKNCFVGSAARRVGPLYAGVDDFTVIAPEFDTCLHTAVPDKNQYRQGSYAQTLLFPDHMVDQPLLESRMYGTYLNSEESQVFLSNDSREKNLPIQSTQKKLVILKDSNVLVVAPYLALSYDEICLVDLRLYVGDLMGFIREYGPDMVLIMYNPGAMEEHNMSMFQFFR